MYIEGIIFFIFIAILIFGLYRIVISGEILIVELNGLRGELAAIRIRLEKIEKGIEKIEK